MYKKNMWNLFLKKIHCNHPRNSLFNFENKRTVLCAFLVCWCMHLLLFFDLAREGRSANRATRYTLKTNSGFSCCQFRWVNVGSFTSIFLSPLKGIGITMSSTTKRYDSTRTITPSKTEWQSKYQVRKKEGIGTRKGRKGGTKDTEKERREHWQQCHLRQTGVKGKA